MKILLIVSVALNVMMAVWAWLSYRAVNDLLDTLEAYRWLEGEMEIGAVDLLIGEGGQPCFNVWRN
jgi:hypothetical protein